VIFSSGDNDVQHARIPNGGESCYLNIPFRRLINLGQFPGYVLALITEACIQHQSGSPSGHSDPIHITAHYLRTTAVSQFEILIRVLKSGRGFTNLTADLVQKVCQGFFAAHCEA
jgi:hypothetical protein